MARQKSSSAREVTVKLVPLEEKDLNFVLNIRREISPLLADAFLKNEDQQRRWYKTVCESDKILVFIIESMDCRIGYAILDKIDYIHRHCYAQVQIEKEFRGKHYGTEAFKRLITIAFEVLGMNKICLDTFITNERATHVYEKLGFQAEGLLRAHYWKDGQFIDAIQMGLLKKDYAY
jgi:diamine N-acetyltransferase